MAVIRSFRVKRFLLKYFKTLLLLEAPLLLIFLILMILAVFPDIADILLLYTQLFFDYPTYYPYINPQFYDGTMVDDWIIAGVRVFLQWVFVAIYTWKKNKVTKILLIVFEVWYYLFVLWRFLVFIII